MTAQWVMPRALGGAAGEGVLRTDLERYRALALEFGASDVAIIPAETSLSMSGCG